MYIYIYYLSRLLPYSVLRATDTDMALEPSFSFPQSHLETTSRTSPFNVNQDDVGKLESCETFQIIRSLLIRQQNSTCVLHYLVLYNTIHSVAPLESDTMAQLLSAPLPFHGRRQGSLATSTRHYSHTYITSHRNLQLCITVGNPCIR